jgi:pimeloyl-ACP methyl ester carboxylesterase
VTYARSGDIDIWYERRGAGSPVVLVYGLGGSGIGWGEAFLDALAERHELAVMDNRGTGRSSLPESAWTIEDMTADVLAVADACGFDRFHLLACSLGTIIARHVVRVHGGERILSLSLLCPPNGIPATDEVMRAAILWDRSRSPLENARGSWPVIHPPEWAAEHDADLVAAFECVMEHPTPGRTFRFQMLATAELPDPAPAINQCTWPVSIIHGSEDPLVPLANAQTLAAQIPRARLTILEGARHNLWDHATDETAREVRSFLAEADTMAATQ